MEMYPRRVGLARPLVYNEFEILTIFASLFNEIWQVSGVRLKVFD